MHSSVAMGEVRPSDKIIIRFQAACEEAGISAPTMRRYIRTGRGPRLVRLSDRVHGFRRCDLEAWIESRAG